MAWLGDVVVDCARPSAVARFWAEVLDGYRVAAYDRAELERLASLGVYDVEDDPTVLVEPVDGSGPRLFFQLVPERKVGKNRLHLDLRTDDLGAEASRLVALGAHIVSTYDDHLVLTDVESNEFCLTADRDVPANPKENPDA